jgi:hypothetical protein
MLGYTGEDVIKMMAAIRIVVSYLPANSSNDEVRKELQNTYDFLDGMLAEGRI